MVTKRKTDLKSKSRQRLGKLALQLQDDAFAAKYLCSGLCDRETFFAAVSDVCQVRGWVVRYDPREEHAE